MIKSNLTDMESRHLMIITDNQENTLQYLVDICQNDKINRNYEPFYNSDFPEDMNEES